MRFLSQIFIAGLISLATMFSFATISFAGDLTAENAAVRMTIPGRPAMAAVVINNAGDTDDKLVSVSSDMTKKIELHETVADNGVMKMRPVADITVPAKGKVALKSGSYHLMLFGLKDGLKPGDTLPLKMTFSSGATLQVNAKVMKMGMDKMDHSEGHDGMKKPEDTTTTQ